MLTVLAARSIGVDRRSIKSGNRTVEAIIAHELGHLTNGDSVLNMVLIVNCLGIIAVLAFYQFALIACVYIIMVICCMMGLFPILVCILLYYKQDFRLDSVCNGSSKDYRSPGEQIGDFCTWA